MPISRRAACILLGVVLLAGRASALDLPPLSGPVILTVTGVTSAAFPDGTAKFDIARLRVIGETKFTTTTIWTEGSHTFAGVSLKALVDVLGASSGSLKCEALNDYVIEIPVSDAVADGPIVAYAMDGEPMSVRDKGPLWVVYPYESDPVYQSETVYSRSIWQLDRIEILP